MKELSIEEKAKRYDEASKWMEGIYPTLTHEQQGEAEVFFPMFKESEDERIRGKIIATIHLYYGEPLEDEAKEMIAWLKKQGEQKTVFEMKTPEESLGIDSDTYNKVVDECIYGEQKPANADLKDIVDKEANAIWKEINTGGSYSVIDSFNQFYGICMQVAEAVVDCKKPAEWSEEDKNFMYDTLSNLTELKDRYGEGYGNVGKCIGWLKSIKDRVFPQPKQEWSGGDEAHLHSLITHLEQWIESNPDTTGADIQGENVAWLKSLKDRYTWKPSDEHCELEEFAKIIRGNLTGISKAVQELFEAKYLQLTGNKMYGGFKD